MCNVSSPWVPERFWVVRGSLNSLSNWSEETYWVPTFIDSVKIVSNLKSFICKVEFQQYDINSVIIVIWSHCDNLPSSVFAFSLLKKNIKSQDFCLSLAGLAHVRQLSAQYRVHSESMEMLKNGSYLTDLLLSSSTCQSVHPEQTVSQGKKWSG